MKNITQLNSARETLRSYSDHAPSKDDHHMAMAAAIHSMCEGGSRAYVGPGADHVNSHLGHPVHSLFNRLHASASEASKPHIEAARSGAVHHFGILKEHAAGMHSAGSEHAARIHEHLTQHVGPTLQHHFGEAGKTVAGHLATLHAHAGAGVDKMHGHLHAIHRTLATHHAAFVSGYHREKARQIQGDIAGRAMNSSVGRFMTGKGK